MNKKFIILIIIISFLCSGCATWVKIWIQDEPPEALEEKEKQEEETVKEKVKDKIVEELFDGKEPNVYIKSNRAVDASVERTPEGKITKVETSTKGKAIFEGMFQPIGQKVLK